MSLLAQLALDAPPPNPPTASLGLALQSDEALAASTLYRRYSQGVRCHLHRVRPAIPIDNIVLSVLIDASRRLRAGDPPTDEQITSTVLECTRAAAEQLPSRPEWPAMLHANLNLQKRSELVNALFSSLTCQDREILLRSFLLTQTDHQISQELSVSIDTIRQVRRTAREQFRRMTVTARRT